MRKGKKVLTIVSLIIFLCALVFVAYQLFKVRTVTVAGCETRSEDEIIALSGLVYDESIFLVDKQEVRDALAQDPYIKPVSVEIKYPDNVLITIEERTPAGYIEKNNAAVIIDHEGWVLEVDMSSDERTYPLILGMPADTFELGQQMGTSDTFKIGVFTRVYDALDAGGIVPSVIDISLAADIVLTLSDGLTVEFGDDTELDEKISLIEASRKEWEQMGKAGGILDVSLVNNAYFREN